MESVNLRQAVTYVIGQLGVFKGQNTGNQNMGREVNTKVYLHPEDGRNTKAFLDVIQIEFMDVGLEVEQWGTKLRRHLTEGAMAYWLYIYETTTNVKDWPAAKRMFMMRFCDNTKAEVMAKLADNVCQKNHGRYSARFAAILAQDEAIPQEQLVEYYLANHPRDCS